MKNVITKSMLDDFFLAAVRAIGPVTASELRRVIGRDPCLVGHEQIVDELFSWTVRPQGSLSSWAHEAAALYSNRFDAEPRIGLLFSYIILYASTMDGPACEWVMDQVLPRCTFLPAWLDTLDVATAVPALAYLLALSCWHSMALHGPYALASAAALAERIMERLGTVVESPNTDSEMIANTTMRLRMEWNEVVELSGSATLVEFWKNRLPKSQYGAK